MRLANSITSDKRFYINPDDLNRIKKKKILFYRIKKIKIGNIKRYLNGNIFDLSKTDSYRLLENPNSIELQKNYNYYCEKYCFEYENRSMNKFKSLTKNIDKETYDPKKGIIIVDNLNIISDGQHRACILLKKYGKNYKVKVLKIYCANLGVKTYIKCLIYSFKKIVNILKIK